MPKARKTIEVQAVKDIANNMLANSLDEPTDSRIAVACLIERVLMDTNNYKGFNYLEGWPCEDETRRHYY